METHPSFRAVPTSHRILAGAVSWGALGGAFLIIAILALAPRWLEAERLQERYVRNAIQIHGLQKEILHLDRLATALESDAEFTARVASAELKTSPDLQVQITLTPELAFDPRDEQQAAPVRASEPRWYWPALELMAGAGEVRHRLAISAAVMIFLSFFCLHEQGPFGGVWQIGSHFFRRWEVRDGSSAGKPHR